MLEGKKISFLFLCINTLSIPIITCASMYGDYRLKLTKPNSAGCVADSLRMMKGRRED